MDRISGLSDDLLVKILWFLETKDAVSTSILSRRWRFLWMWLPKLDYYTTSMSKSGMLRCFLNRTLLLHKAPVIERFRLDLTHTLRNCEDINRWIEFMVSRHLRELAIYSEAVPGYDNILPSSLYVCKSLVVLKLAGVISLDVPSTACLPSLKSLLLHKVTGVDVKSLRELVSISPVLETLSLYFENGMAWRIYGSIRVNVPSLLSLSLCIVEIRDGLEIDTPSLKYFKLEDYFRLYHNASLIKKMPKLEEAYLVVGFDDIESLVGSFTSVKRLTLCCPEAVYSNSFVFKQLEHLKLCGCQKCSSDLLARFLRDSPNLRVLDILQIEGHIDNSEVSWNQPSTVPECFLSSLESFSWSRYMGRPKDRDLVVYILENACRLKTATISSSEIFITKRFQMMQELTSSPRASTTCRLLFD